jgi:hypothetical protein
MSLLRWIVRWWTREHERECERLARRARIHNVEACCRGEEL